MRIPKFLRVFFLFVLVLITTNINVSASEKSDTDVKITIEQKNKKTPIDKKQVNPNNNQYKIVSPKELGYLPKTGELVTSFIFSLMGISAILFVVILLINKNYYGQYRWEI